MSSEGPSVPVPNPHTKWLPGKTLVWAAAAGTLLALGAVAVPAASTAVLCLDGILAIAGLVAWRRLPKHAIAIQRELPRVLAIGRPNPVHLRVHNQSTETLELWIDQELFEGAIAQGLPASLRLGPGQHGDVSFTVQPMQRGRWSLGAHHVRYGRLRGLVVRQECIPATDEVQVFPDVLSVRQYDRLVRLGRSRLPGSSRIRGGESEFERLREYRHDDSVRHVDWKATAKRRELIVRQFQTETQQAVFVLLDCGRAMRGESGGLSFLEHGLNAILMLSHVVLAKGDSIGLLAFDEQPRVFLPPGAGASHERRMLHALYRLEVQETESDFGEAFKLAQSKLHRRSLVVLFTQLLDPEAAKPLVQRLRALQPKHLALCVILRDREVESLLETEQADALQGLYVRSAAAEALLWRRHLLRELKSSGVLVLEALPEQLTPQVVQRYAELKARQML